MDVARELENLARLQAESSTQTTETVGSIVSLLTEMSSQLMELQDRVAALEEA